jgi:hypothetical protein
VPWGPRIFGSSELGIHGLLLYIWQLLAVNPPLSQVFVQPEQAVRVELLLGLALCCQRSECNYVMC